MVDTEKEKQWAENLRKARKQTMLGNDAKSTRKNQIEEELVYFRNKLKKAIDSKDIIQAEKTIEKLILLRAEQLAMEFLDYREENSILPDQIIEKGRQNFFRDCKKLVLSVKTLIV